MSTLETRNLVLRGRRTSLRLERPIWDALEEIATREGTSVAALCETIEADRRERTLASSVRVYVVRYYRDAARASWIVPASGSG
jgi:predicted DNA-binding ribbon-helix-helix protein